MDPNTTNPIVLSSGATLFLRNNVWIAKQLDGQEDIIHSRPVSAFLLLERNPEDFNGQLNDFPLQEVIIAALCSKNLRFIEHSLKWIEVFGFKSNYSQVFTQLLLEIPSSSQKIRHKIKHFLKTHSN